MIGVDTNILVRFITQDDEEQFLRAKQLLNGYEGQAHSIFINNIVLCELIWVLKRGYKYKKDLLLHTLKLFVSIEEFSFENLLYIKRAIELYEQGQADFSDYLLSVINSYSGCQKTFSLDELPVGEHIFSSLDYVKKNVS